jgi:toxin ParE1/3/4
MPDYRLSPKAIADLEDIYAQGLEQFGPAQAERHLHELHGRFQLLSEFPGIAGRPLKGFSPPVHRFPFGAHIILFKHDDAGVVIVRVFQARMDWLRLFDSG